MEQWSNHFLQMSKTEIEDVYLNYKNDHQRKDVNIETNSSNHRYNGVFVQQMMIMDEAFLLQMQISNQLHLKGKDDIKF